VSIQINKKYATLLVLVTSVAMGLFACGGSSSSSPDSNSITTLVTSVNGLNNLEPCAKNAQCLPSAAVLIGGKAVAQMSQVATPWTNTTTNIIDLSKIAYVEGSNDATAYASEGSVFAMTTNPSYVINGFTEPGARFFVGNGLPNTPMGTFPVQSGTAAYAYYSALPGGTNPATGVTYSSAAAIGIGPYNLSSKIPLNPVVTGTYPLICEVPLKAGSGFSYFPPSIIELKSNNEPFVLCSVPSSFNIQVTEY